MVKLYFDNSDEILNGPEKSLRVGDSQHNIEGKNIYGGKIEV